MEWCVHIRDERDLDGDLRLGGLGTLETNPGLQSAVAMALAALSDSFGEISFERVYFGAEFCEQLIPSVDDLVHALDAVIARKLKFTLITPYVSNHGLLKLKSLFETLHHYGTHEVVFSDWGVLNLLRRDFPRLAPIQGRLLNKSLRDPRIAHAFAQLQPTSSGPAPASFAVQRSNLDNSSYLEFLSELGVRMVEIDNAPQGTDFSFAARGIAVSVPYPFGIVTTGRTCLAAALGYAKAEKFQPGAPCHRECQTFLAEVQDSQARQLYLQGNSYFYLQTTEMLRTIVENVQSGAIARLVYQPRLPMLGRMIHPMAKAAQAPVFC